MLTAQALRDIEERYAASEPGEWEHWGDLSNKVMVKGTSCCVCDIRGWGYYTGGSSLNLPEAEAVKRMDANKDFIAKAHQDIPALLADRKALVEVLRTIAKQKLTAELDTEEYINACFQDGYDECVKAARSALQEDR